jgi:hypothetical protein
VGRLDRIAAARLALVRQMQTVVDTHQKPS